MEYLNYFGTSISTKTKNEAFGLINLQNFQSLQVVNVTDECTKHDY